MSPPVQSRCVSECSQLRAFRTHVLSAPLRTLSGVPDETDAFGHPLKPEEETDAFGAPVADWQPPVAPSVQTTADWRPPVSSTPGPPGDPAGWWRRAGAAIIDGLLVGVVAVVIALVASGAFGASDDGETAIAAFVGIFVGSFYYGKLMSREGEMNGRTWGMQVTDIRVVRVDGQPITFGFALIREILVKQILFGYLAVFTLYIATLLNYLWPLWDSRNRALHDHICKTLVRSVP
jgi:uncharacterized RDD family membrane protein YckC